MADAPSATDTQSGNGAQNDDAPLGEAGEKALQAWKERAKAAEKDARRASELEAELNKLRESAMTEQEKAIAKAREEAAAEARKEVEGTYQRQLLEAKVARAAAGKLNDPDDAIRFLDLDTLTDDKAIATAIAGLVEQRPYLAAGATQPQPVDQGARKVQADQGTDMNAAIRRAAGRA